MKNVTLSADERWIEAARAQARSDKSTLNEQFRAWLVAYAGGHARVARARETVDALQGQLKIGRKLTRDEMNDR